MAAGDTDIGTGTTVTFSGFTMELLGVVNSGLSRASHPTSHMGTTGGQTFIPGRTYDPGELVLEVHHKTTEAPPITGATATLTVTFPDAETKSVSAFMTGFDWNDPYEDVMTATATFKCTGDWTF